jgi:hypothetical protein
MLPPEDFSKSGRVKNFVDVVLAAECILKAHIFMGRSEEAAITIYRSARRMGHDIAALAAAADYLDDRAPYEAVAVRLNGIPIALRYSLDMWETFFPALEAQEQTELYDRTVANSVWRRQAVTEVEALIELLSPALTGEVESFDEVFQHELDMAEFVREARIR